MVINLRNMKFARRASSSFDDSTSGSRRELSPEVSEKSFVASSVSLTWQMVQQFSRRDVADRAQHRIVYGYCHVVYGGVRRYKYASIVVIQEVDTVRARSVMYGYGCRI